MHTIRLQAATRLNAVRIVTQDKAYADKDGIYDLDYYNKHPERFAKIIKTNITGFVFAVNTNVRKIQFIEAYLLKDGSPVGLLHLTKMQLNGKVGKVFMPSTYFLKEYRKMGYAKALYKWVLDSGTSLVTGLEQTQDSRFLWAALSHEYQMLFYKNGTLVEKEDADTKLIMLGKGCNKDQLITEFRLADWTVYG